MAVKLQRPSHVFMSGRLVPWDDANIAIYSEALIRAASVFEGIKGYWDTDGETFSLLAPRQHFDRLHRSARLMHLPFTMSYEQFIDSCRQLTEILLVPGRDLWLRPTLLAVEGHWGLDTVTDLVITAYTMAQERPEPIPVGLSSWQRATDRAQPARIKSSANYQVGRLARIEGRRQGFEEMILFNSRGRVAEATGACLVMVRDGRVITPPPYEDCLESITVDIIEVLCRQLRIPFERRPIEMTELHIADEAFLAGTLAELVPIESIDKMPLSGKTPVLDQLTDAFWGAARGAQEFPGIEIAPLIGAGVTR
jgi:branched-chain amino acid aminotransferase